MDSRINILIFLLALLWRRGATTTKCWDETTAEPAMFLASPGGYDPDSLDNTICSASCSSFGYANAGTTGGKYCLCTSKAEPLTGVAGSACSDTCPDMSECGGPSEYTVSLAAGGGPITGFNPTATPAAKSPAVTFASVTSDNPSAEYVLNPNDGSPLVTVADSDVIKFTKTGTHHITLLAGVPNQPFGASTDLQFTIEADPATAKIGCPVVTLPDIPFYCNFSYVQGTGVQGKVTYTDMAGAPTEVALALVDPCDVAIGTAPPRGAISSFETLETFTDTLKTDVIQLADEFPDTLYLTAIEFHVTDPTDGTTFTVTIEKPTCTDEYCPTNDGYCTAAGTCSQIYHKEYECEAPKFFFGNPRTCELSPPSSEPTFEVLETYTVTPTTALFGVHPVSPPLEVPKGSRISTTGSVLTYRKTFSGEAEDLKNGAPSGNRYYLQVIAIDPSFVDVAHTCSDEDEITAQLEATSPVFAPVEDADKPMYCQFPIEGLEATVSKEYVGTGDDDVFSVTITKGSKVSLDFDYGEGNPNVTVPFGGTVDPVVAHEQTYAFTAPGTYTVIIYASNKWSTEINYGLNSTELEVVVQNAVTDDWTVEYTSGTHLYLLDTSVGTADVQIQFECAACSDATIHPTDASALTDWGDGSTPSTEAFPAAYTAPIVVNYGYPAQGKYDIVANISNFVNFKMPTITWQLEIHEKIVNLGVDLGYYPTFTNVYTEAMGTEKDQLPMDYNATLRPKMDYGSVNEYILKFKNGTEITRLAVADPFNPTGDDIEMSHHFPEEGLVNLTLTAISPVTGGDVTVDITIKIVGDVKGIEIDDGGSVSKPGEVKTFNVTFLSIGSGTCMIVDFGNGEKKAYGVEETCTERGLESMYDNTHKELFTPFEISTTYNEEKTYNISISAWNNRPSSAEAELMFPVSNIKCNRPILSIIDAVALPTFIAKTYFKSEQHVFATQATIDCEVLQTTKKRWEIIQIKNATTMEYGLPMPVMDKLATWDKSQIVIDPRFLDYGIYELKYSLTMWGDALPLYITFQSIARTYIEIVPTPLVAILIKGAVAEITRGKDQTILLEAMKYSYDPDDGPEADKSGITFKWWCHKKGETMTGDESAKDIPEGTEYDRAARTDGGCFGEGPGPLKFTSGTWELQAGLLFESDDTNPPEYVITMEISKDTRTATATIVIKVVEQSVPEIEVSCLSTMLCRPPNDEGIFFNSDARLGLRATCVIGSCRDDEINFDWKVQQCFRDNSPSVAIPEVEKYLTFGFENREMTISVDLFTNKTTIECFELTTTAAKKSGDTQPGELIVKLLKNKPPVLGKDGAGQNGKCQLLDAKKDEVTGGVSGVDVFEIACTAPWNDPDKKGIKFYRAFYMAEPPEGGTPIRQDLFSNPAIPVSNLALPPGKYDIMIEAEDVWAGISQPFIIKDTEITMPTKEQLLAALDPTTLSAIAGSGDITQLSSIAQATFSLLNSMPEYDLEGKSPEQQEQIQLEVAQIRKSMLDAMNSQMSMTSEAQRDMALSAVVDAALNIDSDGPSGKNMESQGRQTVVEMLDGIVDSFLANEPTTPQKMQETFRAVATASAGVFNNIASVAKDENCSDAAPPADVANAQEFDYEPGVVEKKVAAPANPLEAIECYAKESTVADSRDQVNSLINNFDKLAKQAMKIAALKETLVFSTPNGLTQKVIKNFASELTMIDLGDSGARIQFPADFLPKSISTEPVNMVARNTYVVAQVFAKNAEKIAASSQAVSAEVFSTRDDVAKIEIYGLDNDPIIIDIPLNPMDLPEPELIDCWSRLDPAYYTCYNEINIESPETVILIRFKKEDADTKFVLLFDYDHMPVPIKDEEGLSYEKSFQFFDSSDDDYLKNNNMEYNETSDTYTISIRNLDPETGKQSNRTGRFFVAVFEVHENCTDWEDCIKGKNDNTFTDVVKKNMSSLYSTVLFSTACYFYDKPMESFSTRGMTLISASPLMVQCTSTHLTDFGSGFFVMPNTIDFNYVFANAGFSDNLTIYLTIIFTVTVYIILLIWACRADRRDVEKLGASPMPDNKMEDKYLYEIMVFTGHKTDASTDSNISFVLSGDKGDTRVRHFGDPERPRFRKGECDVFVLATPGPLGNLNYIRIWHDNTGQGGFASWFLSFIVFKDVQTGHKFEFIANCWFAVDEDDGQIDRLIPVAGLEQKSDFNHLFTTTSQKNLSDGHLWFSVFLRPPRSRFTRCQRVSACMALLYLSMLVNAMWYERTPDKPSGGINFGPFSVSVEQIGIGVMANLIVFPPSFLIVWLFRTARPRKLRESRIDKALEKQGRGKGASNAWADSGGADPKEGSQAELVKQDSIAEENKENKENKDGKKKKKKKKFTLPWGFMVVAWILCIICLLVSIFFLWAYGIQFGNEKTTKWITSLIISFFSSVLFVQPMKVFIMAILLSLICKAVDQDSDDADEDEVDPTLANDEEWMHSHALPRQKMSVFCPLSEAAKREAKEKRLKEKKMISVMWELVFYFTYLTILLVLSYGNRDPNAFLMKTTLENSFIKLGDRDLDYSKVNHAGKWWNWALNVVMNESRPQRFYNGENPYGMKMFLNDYYNRLMGHGIIRQIRVKDHSCKVVKEARGMTTDCAGSSNVLDEDHSDYCRAWSKIGNRTDCSEELNPEYKFTSARELEAYPEVKILDMYGGGGYVMRMKGSMSAVVKRMKVLMHEGWVDELTRALFVEFYVYNAQVNLFGLASITAEFVPGGGIHPSWRFDGIRLLSYHQGFGLFVIICEVCFVLYTVFFTYRAIKEIRKQKSAWFKDYWSWAELFIIIISYCSMITYIVRMITANKITKTFKDTWGNGYIRLQHVYYIDEVFGYMISFIVFVSTLKLIKILRFNKRMGILSATLRHCWDDLTGFLFVFFLSFLAFVQMFYLFLFKNMYDFHNFLTALESCFSMMLGKFSFEEMKNTSMFAAGMFFVFAIVMSVILLNLFITIILRSFEQIKKDLMSQPSEYQIVDFMMTRIKSFVGIRGTHGSSVTPAGSAGARRDIKASEMNAKVDKMLLYINGMYFEGKMDPNSKDAMKSMYMSSNKGQY